MRTYSRDDVKRILRKLAGDGFVHGSDDGCGFSWNIPDSPAHDRRDPNIPRHQEYFDYDVEAAELVKQLREAKLIDSDEGHDAEAFLDNLLQAP